MSTPVTTTTPQGGSISTTPTASRSSSPATPLPSATSSTSSLTNQPASAPTPARLSVQDQAKLLTTDAFDKIIKYICGEIQGSTEDFELLERLNKIAATRYGDMALKAGALVDFSKQLQEKIEVLRPQLDQINILHANVLQLEQVVKSLDVFTADLERQFKLAYQR